MTQATKPKYGPLMHQEVSAGKHLSQRILRIVLADQECRAVLQMWSTCVGSGARWWGSHRLPPEEGEMPTCVMQQRNSWSLRCLIHGEGGGRPDGAVGGEGEKQNACPTSSLPL